ncbi:HAT dimerization, partial [Ascobolus immersus RN42]
DELTRYLSAPRLKGNVNSLDWWFNNRLKYPSLYKMALDAHAIPPMSAVIERVFSSAGCTVTNRRNRLQPNVIEAIECLKDWSRSGVVKSKAIEEVLELL